MPQVLPAAAQVKFLTNKGLGLYLHIPFCEAKCRYCDFYSLSGDPLKKELYKNALLKEIKKWGEKIFRPISSIYIGGGTPSALPAHFLCKILNCVKSSFSVSSDAEITVEVNPKSASLPLFEALINAGVNRLSIGVQSGNDSELKTLGRLHNRKTAEETFLNARKAGFKNISLDLMLALPDSNTQTLKNTLDFFISLSPEHISAYILKIEENTPLFKIKDTLNLPDENEISEQYLLVSRTLQNTGYEHYEISNFAKAGKTSCHNVNYWKCGEYLGIGPAAHSFLEGKRFFYPADIMKFITCPETVFDCFGDDKEEFIMLNLRLKEGLSLSELKNEYNVVPSAAFMNKIKLFEKNGLCTFNNNTVSLTVKGMLVSNEIIAQLEESL